MSGITKDEIVKIVRTSREHPVFFAQEILGDNLWEMQEKILKAVQNYDTTVASCHGGGKSFLAARVVLHAMSVLPGTQVITTAPTNRQVKKVLWKEIRMGHKSAKIPLGGKILTQEMQVDDDWFALGFATDDTDQFQGFHGKRILVVADEAAGVSEAIFDGIDGITSGANSRKLYIGNPTSRTGRFYDSHQNPHFKKFNISAFDTPNFTELGITYEDIVKGTWKEKYMDYVGWPEKEYDEEIWNKTAHRLPYPQLVTPKWVSDRLRSWGAESALFQAKVLGKFPEDEQFTVIPVYMWNKAKEKEGWPEVEDISQVKIGIDVARFGSDESVLAMIIDNKLVEIKTVRKMDTTEVAEWVDSIVRKNFNHLKDWKEVKINVDVIGVGSGVADQLRNSKGYENVRDLKVSEKAKKPNKFMNKRAEMYWNTREGLNDGRLKIGVHSEELENQITSIKYEFRNGKMKVEPKEQIRKRMGESPDKADAVCMADYDFGGSSGGFLSAWQK